MVANISFLNLNYLCCDTAGEGPILMSRAVERKERAAVISTCWHNKAPAGAANVFMQIRITPQFVLGLCAT